MSDDDLIQRFLKNTCLPRDLDPEECGLRQNMVYRDDAIRTLTGMIVTLEAQKASLMQYICEAIRPERGTFRTIDIGDGLGRVTFLLWADNDGHAHLIRV